MTDTFARAAVVLMHFVNRARKSSGVAELDDANGTGTVVDVENEEAMIDDQHAQLVIAELIFWREGTAPRHTSKRFDSGESLLPPPSRGERHLLSDCDVFEKCAYGVEGVIRDQDAIRYWAWPYPRWRPSSSIASRRSRPPPASIVLMP